VALISVLWGIALLSIVAASFLSAGKVSYRHAHNTLEIAQTDAVAEAAINRAILALLDLRPDKRWRVDGIAQTFNFAGTSVRISIQDELGRIDLNHADGSLLVGLFQSAGLDAPLASSLVDKILDWRDTNALKRLNGAKAQDYVRTGRAYRPRNGPFQSVDELKLVMDVTAELFRRVEPALTVYSGRPFIDPRVAPAEALLALPAMDAGKVASLIADRAASTYGQPLPGGASAPSLPVTGRAFTIRAEFEKPSGLPAREAVVRITDDPAKPYWVLSWRRATAADLSRVINQ
jgi:general secretion pathway protein K